MARPRILVLGAGAIGGFFGAHLLAAGADVAFLVRPARAKLLAEHGLRVHTADAEFSRPVRSLTAAEEPADLVLLACKAYDLAAAIEAVRPAVGPSTRVLPLLNGLRHLDVLDAAFGAERVLGGLAHVSVTLEADGAIRQFGPVERLTFGSRDGSAVPAPVREALLAMRPPATESADILGAMWEKFALINTLAGGTCLMRGSLGEILAAGEGADFLQRLFAECRAVAAAAGHALRAEAVAATEAMLTRTGSPLKASMLRDLERGAPTEAEHVLGDLRARALAHGIDTPLLAAALVHLRVYEAARRAR